MILKITQEDGADRTIATEIEQSLRAYNFSVGGPYKLETLLLTVRDEKGNLQGGIKGLIGLDWLFIDSLWVAEPYRHQGYGSKLLLQAEQEAKFQGCSGAFLDTHTYQAPEFYQKHGYKEFGRLENFPLGHSRIYFSKTL